MRLPGLFRCLGFSCLTALFAALPLNLAGAQNHVPNLGANRVADTASLATRTSLAGHRPGWATAAADRGALPDSQRVELILALTRAPEVQAAFEQLLADQQNPSSPRFHQWLTPAQAGAQFGPTQHDLDALTAWLTGQGFSVDAVTPSRIFVQVSAPAAVVSAAFGTNLHRYQVAYGPGEATAETMQAPTAEPSLPAALAPLVAYIGGLTSVPVHTHSHTEVRQAGSADGSTLHPSYSSSGGSHFLAPLDFDKIYDVPATPTGSGEKVMIVGGSRLDPADISNYESITALPAYTPNYIVDPAYADPGQTADGNQVEATLDFNRVYGTAPGAQVDLVIAANWLNGTVNQNLVLYAINTVNDPVMSLSFGACENLQPTGYVKQEDAMYSQAASQGITTLVSSGDAGVTGCAVHDAAPTGSTAYPNINDICASSFVTCVGGTEFNDATNAASYWSSANGTGKESALSYIPEGAWNEPNNTGSNANTVPYILSATGGGPSTVITKPVWQTGTGVPADGVRDTPDISFSASQHDGYFGCLGFAGGGCVATANGTFIEIFSGTSAAAPSMAGVAALLDARLGSRQGNINPILYKLAASSPAAFHDATPATSGVASCSTATPSLCNNSTPSATSLTGGIAGYPLQTGYDLSTGLGSLDVAAFLNAAATPISLTTVDSLTATPSTLTTNQTVVFKDTVTPGPGVSSTAVPTGTVVFTLNSTGAVLGSAPLVAGTAISAPIAFPTAGVFLVNANYSGDTTFMASGAGVSITVSVPALPATTTTLAGTTGSITAQTGATYTATVAPVATNTLAPTGLVQFVRTATTTGTSANLGAAVPLAGGKATLTPTTLPVGSYSITAVYLGDNSFAGSTSSPLPVTSTAIPTTTMLGALPATVTSTAVTAVTASVVSSSGIGTPTGTIQFTVDAAAYGTAISVGATGSVASNLTLPTGSHTVCANYSGDSTFAASGSSPCKTVVSTVTPVTLALASSTTTLFSYQAATLTGTLNGISTSVAPTAAVTFTDSATSPATILGTAALSGTAPGALVVGPLSVGTHVITATYPGDKTYGSATSNPVTITVTLATISLAPASTSIATPAGTPVTDVITLTSLNFAGTENVTCSVTYGGSGSVGTLPACSLSPSAVTFGGSGTATSTLSITSYKRAGITGTNFSSNQSRTLRGLGGLALCSLFAFCLPRRMRKRLGNLQTLAAASLLGLTLAALSGCGSNNFNGGTAVPGAAAGPYTVTITASGATNVSGSTTVGLTIQ